MTLTDFILNLHRISRDFVCRFEDCDLALIRGDILCELPKLISMSKHDVYYICFRPMGFECEPTISRLQCNPLVQHAPVRSSWKVFVDEFGCWAKTS